MNPIQVSCQNINGEFGQKLNQTYDLICSNAQPWLIWREPKNRARPHEGFSGLVEFDHASLQPDQELAEAKMFFDCGCLYLVGKNDKTCWSVWWEADSKNGWMGSLKNAFSYSQEQSPSIPPLQRTTQKVMIRSTSQRSGVNRDLGSSQVKAENNSLSVAKYTFNGKLLWWRFEK